jgi:hypothetical protein
VVTTGTNGASAIFIDLGVSGSGKSYSIINCTFYGVNATGTCVSSSISVATANLYNNLFIGFATSTAIQDQTINAASNAGTPGVVGDLGIVPDTADVISANDLHLSAQGVTKYQGLGVNRSAQNNFDFDFDLETRPGGAWTVGGDEPYDDVELPSQNAIMHGTNF